MKEYLHLQSPPEFRESSHRDPEEADCGLKCNLIQSTWTILCSPAVKVVDVFTLLAAVTPVQISNFSS